MLQECKYFFRSKLFVSWTKEKADLLTSNNTNGETPEKTIALRQGETVFNTFVIQQCVKKDKCVSKIAFRFRAFPKIPKMLETHAQSLIFNTNAKLKCRELWYFGQTAKQSATKYSIWDELQNENATKSKNCTKNHKMKMSRKFFGLK